jgi:hypothetical protein
LFLSFPAEKTWGFESPAKTSNLNEVIPLNKFSFLLFVRLVATTYWLPCIWPSDCTFRHQKDCAKQWMIRIFLFLKAIGYIAAHRELCSALRERTCSLSQTKWWIRRFMDCDLPRQNTST